MRNPTDGGRIIEIPYVAADVETTGLSAADGHRVCEFALLRFLRGTVIDSFVSLVNPLRPIDPGASAVNGITDAMVAGAPTFADLLPRILDFLADDPLVFHNAPFDLSFLRSEARIAGGSWPGNRVIDTLSAGPPDRALPLPLPPEHLPGTRHRLHLPPGGSRRLGRGEIIIAPRSGEPGSLSPLLGIPFPPPHHK